MIKAPTNLVELALISGFVIVSLLTSFFILRFVFYWANSMKKAFYVFLGSALAVRFFYFWSRYDFGLHKNLANALSWGLGACLLSCFVFTFVMIFKMYKIKKGF